MTIQPPTPMSEPTPSAQSSAGPAHPSLGQMTGDLLDQGTYPELLEAPNSLSVSGQWHQVTPRYARSQMLQQALLMLLLVAVGIFLLVGPKQYLPAVVVGVLAVAAAVMLVIIPRQARAIGYLLRAEDIVFRRGILFQRMIAVPYGRLQLVDITQGPLDQAFGIVKLKLVTAAATTGVEIPGLTRPAAEALRDYLIDVAETRRTGL